jgi:hypothetical protein
MPDTKTKFYIELPADKYGNVSLPVAVIQGRIVQGGTPEASERHFTNPDRQVLLFDAPAEITSRWAGVYTDAYGGYAETEGPARMLTRMEYHHIIAIREDAMRRSPVS